MKACSRCKRDLPFESFSKDKRRKDGLDPWCRTCKREQKQANAERYGAVAKVYRDANKEQRSLSWSAWYDQNKDRRSEYARDPATKERQRLREAANRQKDPERYRGYKQTFRERHSAKLYAEFKQWAAANPVRLRDLKRAAEVRRRDRQLATGERVSADFALTVHMKFSRRCFKCSRDWDLCIDHHLPLASMVPLTLENAVLLCRSCNSRKGSRPPARFYTEAELAELECRYGIAPAPSPSAITEDI